MNDPRLTPANGRVALESLRGIVPADRYVNGEPLRVIRTTADLLDAPGGLRNRQMIFGETFLVIDRQEGHAFGQSDRDGYVGWMRQEALGQPAGPATHRVATPATHAYWHPDIKRGEARLLSLGSLLHVVDERGAFAETTDGWFVPRSHLRPVDTLEPDPVDVAERLLGTPYLWGGNSREGIDCSGLVQIALLSAGVACPGDSDLQREASAEAMGAELPPGTPLKRGDLVFWTGHVALVADKRRLIHANGHAMAVTHEGIEAAFARILASDGLPVSKLRRPALP
ncbi:NLP/P60 hydrolase [Haematobacter massiliensis]|uniref:Uncharacterized protein n=1 Tax=Haematobacter massiliensis TaxID=195105 RepID=A0A086XZG4_9RHOB|nr:NlpC/P60 family protein [Haematobacter massiliensis]KFI27414.1 hypothetical protein CN97_01550 [Haematobacter massiliensis]OWJ70832.1 NLP/P60 hydrolase [Haematobacter massiliensis]OWJ84846.1 NLP/P60 hydrolase [Haematobacter massiliensis]QBJ23862.1 NLP/P60 hydrolase [Haematobacter massiliensis]